MEIEASRPMRALRPRIPFALRLVGFCALLMGLTVGLSSYLVYRTSTSELAESLGRELLAIARSSAALIDADVVSLIHHSQDGGIAFEREFELIRDQLDRIRRATGLRPVGSPIYIMRPSRDFERTGLLEFVVMPDRDETGRYFVGNLYRAEPHNLAALQGRATTSGLYQDEAGTWISASAPLYDSDGVLVGIVQVDREVEYFLEEASAHALSILEGALLSIGIGALLCVPFARGMVRPIQEIARGVGAIGGGHLDHRIATTRNDEIGDLAEGVNRMAANLEAAREHQETTSRALVTSGRLASVGQLAAGVAHEINNPLTYVRTNIAMLLEEWIRLAKQLRAGEPIDPESHLISDGEEMLNESLEGVDRALYIVRDIKGLAHAGDRSMEYNDLNALLDGVLRVASPQLGGGVEIDRRYEALPLVPCAGQEIKQVFLNLVMNANHAVGASGTITLSTRFDDARVEVSVEDDGHGIPDDVRDRVFDPFFTTKPVGDGTGLGLAISWEIVRRHHGELLVESEVGRGSRFTVILPVSE